MKRLIFRILIICAFAFDLAKTKAWQPDNGDGTYKNPPLYADYPDPDIIRVGEDFYIVSTTFVDSPGITILYSKDLVNWEIISHAASTVDGEVLSACKQGVTRPSIDGNMASGHPNLPSCNTQHQYSPPMGAREK